MLAAAQIWARKSFARLAILSGALKKTNCAWCAPCDSRRASISRSSRNCCRHRRLAPEILVVSAERLRDELTKILTEGAARRGFELLDELGLLPHVLPEIARMKGVEQPPQFHPEGDVWIHTR